MSQQSRVLSEKREELILTRISSQEEEQRDIDQAPQDLTVLSVKLIERRLCFHRVTK